MTKHIYSPEVTSWLDFFFWYLKWWTRKILIKFNIEWWKFNIIFQKESHSFWFEVTTHPNFFYKATVTREINSYCTDVKMKSVNVMQCPRTSFNTCTLICTYLGVNPCTLQILLNHTAKFVLIYSLYSCKLSWPEFIILILCININNIS